MARTALWAPAHRVAQRFFQATQSAPNLSPNIDAGGNAIQDGRLPWNIANSATGAQVCGWMQAHPVIDLVPATASTVSIAAAQVPVTGVPLTLVTASGAGAIIATSPLLALPALTTIPVTAVYIDSVMAYRRFGTTDYTVLYDAATMCGRAVQIHSVGNDSAATATVVGWDAYGYLTHSSVTMGSNSTVTTTKTFKAIQSITCVGTLSGSNVSAGQADVFGMPMYAAGANAVWGFWNSLIFTGAGTFVAGVTTSPATAATGDVRGTYAVASASDGTKRLTLWQHPVLSAMVTSGFNVGIFGVAQF
jgi:hypothetical protein